MIAAVSDPRQIVTLHRGPVFDVDLVRWTGRGGVEVEKIAVRHRGAVAVVPVLDDGRLVLIRNHRATLEDWLVEFCAGGIAAGEAALAAAGRELAEETGYRAGAIEPLGSFFTAPGFSDELMQVFVAGELALGERRLEPDERIEVEVCEPDEIAARIAWGEIRDGKTIAAFHLWRAKGEPRPTASTGGPPR